MKGRHFSLVFLNPFNKHFRAFAFLLEASKILKVKSLNMFSIRNSMDSVFASKELEEPGYKSSDPFLESGRSSDRWLSNSIFRSHLMPCRPFLMGWAFATVIHLCIILLVLAIAFPMRLSPSDMTCSKKLSTYCKCSSFLVLCAEALAFILLQKTDICSAYARSCQV